MMIKKRACFLTALVYLLLLCVAAKTEACKPSGILKGKKPPKDKCNQQNDSECCVEGKPYHTYKCSPRITGRTKATLTLNSFERGGDGGAPSECDNKYHSNKTLVVALSTGWFNHRRRCLHKVRIIGNGRSVVATVVDECDSTMGCDADHDFQPPCPNNIVDGSPAVWEALGVPPKEWGEMEVFWSDL